MDTAQKNKKVNGKSSQQSVNQPTGGLTTATAETTVKDAVAANTTHPRMEVPTPSTPAIKELSSRILAVTYTHNQLRKRMRLLKDFINFKLFQDPKRNGGKVKNAFLEIIANFLEKYPLYKSEAHWISNLGEDFFKQFTDYNTSNLLKDLNQYLDSLPTPVLFLPFRLSDDLVYEKEIALEDQLTDKPVGENTLLPTQILVEIGTWFKKNVAPTFIFEPQYNPDLVGGCAISLNGVFKDFSLRTRVEENHQAIVELLRGVKKI